MRVWGSEDVGFGRVGFSKDHWFWLYSMGLYSISRSLLTTSKHVWQQCRTFCLLTPAVTSARLRPWLRVESLAERARARPMRTQRTGSCSGPPAELTVRPTQPQLHFILFTPLHFSDTNHYWVVFFFTFQMRIMCKCTREKPQSWTPLWIRSLLVWSAPPPPPFLDHSSAGRGYESWCV